MQLCHILQGGIDDIEGVQVEIKNGKEHRFVLRFTGKGLDGYVEDLDPVFHLS